MRGLASYIPRLFLRYFRGVSEGTLRTARGGDKGFLRGVSGVMRFRRQYFCIHFEESGCWGWAKAWTGHVEGGEREPRTCQVLELPCSCMHASQINAGPVPSRRAQNQQCQNLCLVEPLFEAATPRVLLAPRQLPFCLSSHRGGAQRRCLGGRNPLVDLLGLE